MTIHAFTQRLGSCLTFGGLAVLAVAFLCWVNGDGDGVVNTVHNVGALILATFGAFSLITGLALAMLVPGTATAES